MLIYLKGETGKVTYNGKILEYALSNLNLCILIDGSNIQVMIPISPLTQQ